MGIIASIICQKDTTCLHDKKKQKKKYCLMCRVGQVGDFAEELMKSVGGNLQLESNLGEHGNPAEDIDGDNQSSVTRLVWSTG